MKVPLVIIIGIVAGILGFLLIYSQQRDLPVQAKGTAPVSASAVVPAPGHDSK